MAGLVLREWSLGVDKIFAWRRLHWLVTLVVKDPPANAGDIRDLCSIPGLGRSPARGHGNPLQYSCLENPTDRRAWQARCRKESGVTEVTPQACTRLVNRICGGELVGTVNF